MIIETLGVKNEGYIHCTSRLFSSHDVISGQKEHQFKIGINRLNGEIDSGVWAVSYLLSMYRHRPDDFQIFDAPECVINGDTVMSLMELADYCCYMDTLHPIFSTGYTVRELISDGLKKTGSGYSVDDIKSLFQLDDLRFKRPVICAGNEAFRAMAAVGVAYGKQIFCFPWLTQKKYNYYGLNLGYALQVLSDLNKIVVIPVDV